MKPTPALRARILAGSIASLLAAPAAQAATFTWSNLDNGTPVANGNWSGGESWNAVPVSAADTTLSFTYTYGSNSTAETNTLTNDVANPFQLNVLTLGVNNPTAGNGSFTALINIAGSPLDFVTNGATTPQVNLSQNRSNGQVVSSNVQSDLVLDANTAFTGNGTANFTFSGAISGAGNFTKGGTSKLTLSGTNSYGGTTTISGGILQFTNAASLYNNNTVAGGWTATNISVASGATLALNVGGANQFTAANVNTLLTNLGGANGSSTTGFAAGSTLALDTTGASINVTGDIVNSTGTGGGAVGVTKWGTNLLTLSGANTYTGTTSILQGSLTLAPTAGGMNLGTVTATTSGAGFTAGNITLTLGGGAGTNTITSITETSNAGQQLAIIKNTAATWSVGNVDLKQGNTSRVSAGILNLDGTLKFGLGGASTTLRQFFVDGGTLGYNNAGAVQTSGTTSATVTTGQWLTMSGGALDNLSGAVITTSAHNPNMMLNANLTFTGSNSLDFGTGRVSLGSTAGTSRTITVSANTLTLGGIVSNGTTATALTKAGAGTLTLGGFNTYSGGTTVSGGTLSVGVATNLGGAAANLVFDGGTLQVTGTALTSLTDLGRTNPVIFNAGKTVGLDIADPTNTFTVGQVLNQTTGGFTKSGTGTAILDQANTYTGDTTVSGGKLLVSGSTAAGLVTVSSTATLGGSGSTGVVTVENGGTLAPGSSIESLGVDSVDFLASSTFAYEFDTALYAGTPDASGDLLHIKADPPPGALNIASGAILTLTELAVTSTALTPGSKLTLISYNSTPPTVVFTHGGSPLADGDIKTIGANTWQFDYDDTSGGPNFAADQAGAGNFFTMTVVVPEAGTAGLLALGLLLLRRLRRR